MPLTRRQSARFHSPSRLDALPNELLYMIFYLTSFQGRVGLVLSNKRLFHTFNLLLYQDVRLDTPQQLVRLYRSTAAKRRLRGTRRLDVHSGIFSYVKWEGIKIRLPPATFLARVLNEASSLRELEFHYDISIEIPQWDFETRFALDLIPWPSKPTFLPKLASFNHPLGLQSFALQLIPGRPLAHIATGLTHFQTRNHMGYRVSKLTPESAALELQIIELGNMDQSTAHIGRTIQYYLESCGRQTIVEHMQLIVEFALCESQDGLYKGQMFQWTQDVFSVSGYSQLKSLLVYFNPRFSDEPLDEQYSTLQSLRVLMPSLVLVVLGSPEVEWRRHTPEPEHAPSVHKSDIPEWTPRPDYSSKVLEWWLHVSRFDVSEMEGDPGSTAERLRAIMQARWEETCVPSVSALQAQFSAIVDNRSVLPASA